MTPIFLCRFVTSFSRDLNQELRRLRRHVLANPPLFSMVVVLPAPLGPKSRRRSRLFYVEVYAVYSFECAVVLCNLILSHWVTCVPLIVNSEVVFCTLHKGKYNFRLKNRSEENFVNPPMFEIFLDCIMFSLLTIKPTKSAGETYLGPVHDTLALQTVPCRKTVPKKEIVKFQRVFLSPLLL